MTDKFKPVGFKQTPFIPKTETRIFLGGRPIDQQTEQASSKGLNKQHYQSERTNEINPGYGPCSWSNPNCECYIGQGRIPLHLACPATDCSGDGNAYQWVHNNCGGRIYINTSAYLNCMDCGTSGYITHWEFKCWKHPGDFWPTKTDDCIEALSTVLKLYPNKPTSIKKIIRQISNTLMDNDGGY